MSESKLPDDDGASIGASGSDGPTKKRLDPGFKRNIMLIGGVAGVAVLIVLGMVLRPSSAPASGGPKSELSMGTVSSQTVDNMTPEMQRKLVEKQAQEAADAARKNQSYIPPDTSPVRPYDAGPGQSSLAQASMPVTNYNQQANSEQDSRKREGLMRQLGLLVDPTNDSAGVRQRVEERESNAAGTAVAKAGNATGTSDGGAAVAPAAAGKQLIPGLEISSAVLASDLKVPANGTAFASARVTSGPATGAYMIGSAKVVDEQLALTFTQMRLGTTTYAIDAIVLDEKTASNAIEGNVDRRILQRYFFPVALAMAQAAANARAQTGSTVVVVGSGSGGAAGVATPSPTVNQARAAGIAAGLGLAGQEAQKMAQQPIVVSLGMNFPVGILFRAPVMEVATK